MQEHAKKQDKTNKVLLTWVEGGREATRDPWSRHSTVLPATRSLRSSEAPWSGVGKQADGRFKCASSVGNKDFLIGAAREL